ncbi:hypothetical protein [Ancylobacter terrae]|uniref:hypothetical protein n=1 Tax=Ancylobacter sp. sgz301288 TaxID=3342077 RepID=UPI00385C2781
MTPHPRIPPMIRLSRERVTLVIEMAPEGDCLVPPLVIELDPATRLALLQTLAEDVRRMIIWRGPVSRHIPLTI